MCAKPTSRSTRWVCSKPTISLGMSTEEVSGPRLLAEIAEQTRPCIFRHVGPRSAERGHTIGIELRNQCAGIPVIQSREGRKFRRVEVRVNPQPGLPALKVHWRQGYYAPGR